MRRALLTLLALLGVGSALVVTASSTMRQAADAGMDTELVRGALVALLEVVNVAGTWTWLSDPRVHVRVEAAVGVGLASLVTGTCGALTYGPLGLVAPAGLLAAVHLLSRLWTVAAPSDGGAAAGPPDRVTVGAVPGPAGTAGTAGTPPGPGGGPLDLEGPTTSGAAATRLPAARAAAPGLHITTPAAAAGPETADRSASSDWSDDAAVLADLRRRAVADPTPRSLRTHYGMRHDRATRLVTEYAEAPDQTDRSATSGAGTGALPAIAEEATS